MDCWPLYMQSGEIIKQASANAPIKYTPNIVVCRSIAWDTTSLELQVQIYHYGEVHVTIY